jgi:hypothetical protein
MIVPKPVAVNPAVLSNEQTFVVYLSMLSGDSYTMEVSPGQSVYSLKEQFEQKYQVCDPRCCELVHATFSSNAMENARPLEFYGVIENSQLTVLVNSLPPGSFLRTFGSQRPGAPPGNFLLHEPTHAFVDAQTGYALVCDYGKHRVLCLEDGGRGKRKWQYGKTSLRGADEGELYYPVMTAIGGPTDAYETDRIVFVLDSGNFRVVALRLSDGAFLYSFGGRTPTYGAPDQPLTDFEWTTSNSIAVDVFTVLVSITLPQSRVLQFDVSGCFPGGPPPLLLSSMTQMTRDSSGYGSSYLSTPFGVAFGRSNDEILVLFDSQYLADNMTVSVFNSSGCFQRHVIFESDPRFRDGHFHARHPWGHNPFSRAFCVDRTRGLIYIAQTQNSVSVFNMETESYCGCLQSQNEPSMPGLSSTDEVNETMRLESIADGVIVCAAGAGLDERNGELLVADMTLHRISGYVAFQLN